jgi:hypothetical protein
MNASQNFDFRAGESKGALPFASGQCRGDTESIVTILQTCPPLFTESCATDITIGGQRRHVQLWFDKCTYV